jgi:hypothetical protein
MYYVCQSVYARGGIHTTTILSKRGKDTKVQKAVGIVTPSMTLPGSSKPTLYQPLQASKAAPTTRIEATNASVAVPFPHIRPEEMRVQWYREQCVNDDGSEKEVIKKPVERGWGYLVSS